MTGLSHVSMSPTMHSTSYLHTLICSQGLGPSWACSRMVSPLLADPYCLKSVLRACAVAWLSTHQGLHNSYTVCTDHPSTLSLDTCSASHAAPAIVNGASPLLCQLQAPHITAAQSCAGWNQQHYPCAHHPGGVPSLRYVSGVCVALCRG